MPRFRFTGRNSDNKLESTVELVNVFVNIVIAIALTVITIISAEVVIIQPNITI